MNVRNASLSDARAIARIHVATWQVAYKDLMPAAYLSSLSVDEREGKWREALSKSTYCQYVVEEQGKIMGFANGGKSRDEDALEKAGELYAIYIDHTAFGRGLGSALEERVVHTLKQDGFQTITLWVIDENIRARAFYESRGWHEEGMEKIDERDGFQLREIRYRKEL